MAIHFARPPRGLQDSWHKSQTCASWDLGQVAVLVKVNKQTKPYIGNSTDASYQELIGNIDGMILGELIDSNDELKGNLAKPNSGYTLSGLLRGYYTPSSMVDSGKYLLSNKKVRNRYETFSQLFSEEEIRDQVLRFAKNYLYYKDISGLEPEQARTTDIDTEAKEASDAFILWLKSSVLVEEKNKKRDLEKNKPKDIRDR